MEACGLYYAGNSDAACHILGTIDRTWLENNLLGLYILSRCYEDKQDWKKVEDTYYQMLAIFNSARDMGLDSISFRKFKYRMALLNERVFEDPGLGIIRSLLSENPSYDKYHKALRWMLLKHEDIIAGVKREEDEEPCELVRVLIDGSVPEDEFITRMQAERAEKSSAWNEYRRYINALKLPMAC